MGELPPRHAHSASTPLWYMDNGPDEGDTGSSPPPLRGVLSETLPSSPHPTPTTPQYMDEKMKVLMKESPWAPLTIVKGGQVREGGGRGGGIVNGGQVYVLRGKRGGSGEG